MLLANKVWLDWSYCCHLAVQMLSSHGAKNKQVLLTLSTPLYMLKEKCAFFKVLSAGIWIRSQSC